MTFFSEFLSNTRNTVLARNPCVCIAFAFIVGIVSFRSFPIEAGSFWLVVCAAVAAICCIALATYAPYGRLTFLFLWFAVAGYVNCGIHQQQYGTLPAGDFVRAKIISVVEEKPRSYKATVETKDARPCKAIVYFQKDTIAKSLSYGDVVTMRNTFSPIEKQDGATFNYQGFLANQYIYSRAYVPAKNWEKTGREESLFSYCMQLRDSALATLRMFGLAEHNYQLIAALAFGDKTLLDEETRMNFSTAGAMHILAVSGLHVGIVNGILFFLFSFISNPRLLWLKIVCCISGVWMYASLTGMSPSVERAAIMCSLVSVALLLRRHTSTYNSLAAAAFISLLLSPNDVFSVSFQLSYMAVLSILYFGNIIQSLFVSETPIGRYVWGIVSVSVSVQIGTMPLTSHYFSTIATYSLLTNIIVIPLAFVLLVGVLLALGVSWIPPLARLVVSVLNFVSDYLQDCIADITTFPHANIHLDISDRLVLTLYICIALFVVLFEFFRHLQIKKDLLRL